jgi:hypothetical protein
VDGGGISDPDDALGCYATRDEGPRVSYRQAIEVQDDFGSHVLSLWRPHRLCVPSALGGGSVPSGDVQRCYKVRTVAGDPGPVPVVVSNEFDTRSYTLRGIVELCTPANTGSGVVDPDQVITCYSGAKKGDHLL